MPTVIAALATLVIATTACGGDGGSAADARSHDKTVVYFLKDHGERLASVERRVEGRAVDAASAARLLTSGPTADEREDGVTSAVPQEVRLISVSIDQGVATVDVTGLPRPGQPIRDARIIAQFVRSLVGESGVRAVAIENDGEPWGLVGMDGGILTGPFTYDDLVSWGSVCSGAQSAETTTSDCFSPLP